MDLTYLRLAAANYSRLLFRMANAKEWPTQRKTPEEIQEFIKKQGYDQTVALADRVKAYVRTWDEIHPETRQYLDRKSDW